MFCCFVLGWGGGSFFFIHQLRYLLRSATEEYTANTPYPAEVVGQLRSIRSPGWGKSGARLFRLGLICDRRDIPGKQEPSDCCGDRF